MRSRARMAPVAVVVSLLLASSAVLAVDDPDEQLPGKITIVKTGSLFKFIAKPAGTFALPSSGNEPTASASLRVFDTGTSAGDDTYPLAPSGWTGLGNPSGSKGFKYK